MLAEEEPRTVFWGDSMGQPWITGKRFPCLLERSAQGYPSGARYKAGTAPMWRKLDILPLLGSGTDHHAHDDDDPVLVRYPSSRIINPLAWSCGL